MPSTTTHTPNRTRLPLVLLAVAAAGVGGYVLGAHGFPLPARQSPQGMEFTKAVEKAVAPVVMDIGIAARRAQIAAMRREHDALREKHPHFTGHARDLSSANAALIDAQNGLESVDRWMIRKDDDATQFLLREVDRALVEARGYIDRASK